MVEANQILAWDKLLNNEEFWGTVLPAVTSYLESQQKEVRDVVIGHAYCTECLEYIPGGAEALIKGGRVRHIRCQLETEPGELLPGGHVDNAPNVPWWLEYKEYDDLDRRKWQKED